MHYMSELEVRLCTWKEKSNKDDNTTAMFTEWRQILRHRSKIFEEKISWSAEAKYLGHKSWWFLTWKTHMKAMMCKVRQRFLAPCSFLKCRTLNRKMKTHLCKSLLRAVLPQGAPAWGYAAKSSMNTFVVLSEVLRTIRSAQKSVNWLV